MNKALALGALLSGSIALGSCASFSPPERPSYTGPDTISQVAPAQLVGQWTVTELNPVPNTESQSTTIEYREDGTVLGTIAPTTQSTDALGNLSFQLSGQWTVEGDRVRHSQMEVNSTSDSAVGAMVSRLLNNTKGISGQADIYELSENRMVMVGTDGAAMEYIRQ